MPTGEPVELGPNQIVLFTILLALFVSSAMPDLGALTEAS